MMELVVGAPRLPAAEKVAGVGVSIAGFVGAPVRKLLEPALDHRSDAAIEAGESLLELIRVVIQEAIELVDLNLVLDRVDLNALMRKIDLDQLLERVDLNALMEQIDVNELMGRVDVEALLNRIDINQVMEQVDLDGIVERTEIGSLVVRSTSGVATQALDGVRSRAVGVDATIARVVDRILRRDPGPPGPGLAAPEAPA